MLLLSCFIELIVPRSDLIIINHRRIVESRSTFPCTAPVAYEICMMFARNNYIYVRDLVINLYVLPLELSQQSFRHLFLMSTRALEMPLYNILSVTPNIN